MESKKDQLEVERREANALTLRGMILHAMGLLRLGDSDHALEVLGDALNRFAPVPLREEIE